MVASAVIMPALNNNPPPACPGSGARHLRTQISPLTPTQGYHGAMTPKPTTMPSHAIQDASPSLARMGRERVSDAIEAFAATQAKGKHPNVLPGDVMLRLMDGRWTVIRDAKALLPYGLTPPSDDELPAHVTARLHLLGAC